MAGAYENVMNSNKHLLPFSTYQSEMIRVAGESGFSFSQRF